MSEYRITYISDEDGTGVQGSGYGFNGQDAVRNFLNFSCDGQQIVSVQYVRRVA